MSLRQDERIVPAVVTALSALSLVFHALLNRRSRTAAGVGYTGEVKRRHGVKRVGSPAIFAFKLLRLGSVAALAAMALFTAKTWSWDKTVLVVATAYCVILAALNPFAPAAISIVFSFHLSMGTFSIFAVYAYRDIWPLMTFTLRPRDESEGVFLWTKVALAGLAGIAIPLLEPHPYVPVDPEEPSPKPHPEQTASILSFLTYAFMDPTVFKASRQDHLGFDDLPALCDYDAAKNLIKTSHTYLNPLFSARKANLFFALVWIFRRTFFHQSVILTLMAMSALAGPIGTNRLLRYVEHRPEEVFVKPWVWILCLAFGPLMHRTLYQLYFFLSSSCLARTEAIISSLVFDHALRIRVKAETHEPTSDYFNIAQRAARGSDVEGSPAAEGELSNGQDADSPTTTVATGLVASTERSENTEGTKGDASERREKQYDGTTRNILGTVHNLVTSDLDNITSGRDFLFVFFSPPIQILLGMIFLYAVLGWSAFVGLAVMIALVPVPAKVATLMGVQKEKMKATDARVETVTEIMSVLCMVKLFGWEMRVKESVAKTRETELRAIWRRKVLEVTNNILNHTVPLMHMVATYSTFTLIQKEPLTASIVFSSLTAFNMIRDQISRVFSMLPMMVQGYVSLGRVAGF